MSNITAIISFFDNLWPYVVAVLLFLLLILVHELGHFLAAKCMGVRVNEFSIGFGPKIFKKKWGETTYALGLVPLGGYCAMEGEDEESADSKAFCNKKPWRRFIIVIMGATFNILFGFILIGIILAPEKRFTTTTIAEFHENALSEQTGLKVDDKIIKVDGRRIYTTYDLGYAFTNIDDGKIDILVQRNNKKVLLKDVTFSTEKEKDITYLNVDFYVYPQKKTVFSFVGQTAKTAVSYCAVIWRSLLDLIGGKYGISAMSGPVGVTAAIGSAAKQSLRNLLPIMALIAINLGIMNLLPIPALDGGRLVFILFEMIVGKPVPQDKEAIVHTIGFIVLIVFMLLITAKDIFTLITG